MEVMRGKEEDEVSRSVETVENGENDEWKPKDGKWESKERQREEDVKNNDVDDALGDCCVDQLDVEVALREMDEELDADVGPHDGVDDWRDVELALGEQLVLHFCFEYALLFPFSRFFALLILLFVL